MSKQGKVRQYAIYDHPADYPRGFVVREWVISADRSEAGQAWAATSLEDARSLIPHGSERIEPHQLDDPKIVEVWA
jgi:hypothetical protein